MRESCVLIRRVLFLAKLLIAIPVSLFIAKLFLGTLVTPSDYFAVLYFIVL